MLGAYDDSALFWQKYVKQVSANNHRLVDFMF